MTIPFLEDYLQKRNHKIKIECLQITNNHQWISIEEIAGLVRISIRIATKHVEWGINERIIIGSIENNMFERHRERTREEISLTIPYELDEL